MDIALWTFSPVHRRRPRIHCCALSPSFRDILSSVTAGALDANMLHLRGVMRPETENAQVTHLFPAIWGKGFEHIRAILIYVRFSKQAQYVLMDKWGVCCILKMERHQLVPETEITGYTSDQKTYLHSTLIYKHVRYTVQNRFLSCPIIYFLTYLFHRTFFGSCVVSVS